MSEAVAGGGTATVAPAITGAVPGSTRLWSRPDGRRNLQLVLASIWLLDGVLQLQGFFFTKAFGNQMLSMTARGNPSVIAHPITWSGSTIAHHAVVTDSLFVLVQVAIGLGIAWRPTLKVALVASIVWSLGVWWVGEGLGGVLTGAADTVNGAPGAVTIYALLAILLWPTDHSSSPAPFIAARAVGAPSAKAVWLVLWGSLSYFAVAGANSASQDLHDLLATEASGEPGWLATLDHQAASLVAHRGLGFTVVLAVLAGIVAIGAYLPPRAANATVVLAIMLALAIWAIGENFGALFTNGATDVNSGPLLILLALAYWRPSAQEVRPHEVATASSPAGA